MKPSHIATAADLRRIEAAPYREFMPHREVLDALADTAARHGGRPALTALVTADADAAADVLRWSHAEFIAEVRRSANLFRELAGDEMPRVALLLPPVAQAYFALFGAEAAGVACPINFMLGSAHIAELVNVARANILVALGPHPQFEIASKVEEVRASCPRLRHLLSVRSPGVVEVGDDSLPDFDTQRARMAGDKLSLEPARKADENADRSADADDDADDDADIAKPADRLAALFHTGGTTGAPKLAQHTHGNQLHASWGAACLYGSTEHDVILNGFPLFHVAGSLVFGLSTLLAGGEVVLPPPLGFRDPGFVVDYWRIVERHRVTLLAAVPTVIATLLNVPRGGADITHVRALLTGGSPLPCELALKFEQQTGIAVRNILGMTECAGVISIEPFHAPRVAGSCGLPLPFTEVRATRADGSVCPVGESGVLRVRGPNVGPGYTDARSNAGTFDGGWLVTGDIGHVDAEGRVFVTGRAKDVIIRGSHNIDPAMIEEALLRHPQVQMAAAVGEPDEHAGELPVAFVMLKGVMLKGVMLEGAMPDSRSDGTRVVSEAELLSFVQQQIAERAAVPRRITVLPALPLTAIGKVYKPALRLRAIETAIGERLRRAGLAGRVCVEGVEQGAGLGLRFVVAADEDADSLAPALRELMSAFALAFEIEGATR